MALWTFRRNENDVVNLYNTLSPVMQLATGEEQFVSEIAYIMTTLHEEGYDN